MRVHLSPQDNSFLSYLVTEKSAIRFAMQAPLQQDGTEIIINSQNLGR